MMNREDYFEHVERCFAFLIEEFGFHITNRQEIGDNFSVEYCTDRVYVRVLKTAPDFEPYFVFGRIGVDDIEGSSSFDWCDVNDLDCCRDWQWQCDESQPFNGRIVQLARLLRECGSDALRSKNEVFVKMVKRRGELQKQHALEEREQVLRSQAKAAWNNKDYEAVVKLYDEIGKRLSDVEKKRMAYASKQLLP